MLSKKIIIILLGLSVMALVISCGNGTNKNKSNSSAKKITKISSKKEPASNKNLTSEVSNSSSQKKRGAQNDQGTPPQQIKKAKELIAAVSEEKLASMRANKLFKNYCSICHGFKGNMEINGAKDLTKSVLSLEESVAQVYHGKGLMTPFKGIMKDDEIVAVSKYIEELRK